MLKSLANALQLIGYFSASRPKWGIRDLAKESGVHPAVVHRILATYAEEGFLFQDEFGRYSLGLRWFELGEIVKSTLSPTQIVEPILRRLSIQSGETAFLSVVAGCDGLCIDIVHSDQVLRFSIEEGQRFSLAFGAHGKAILAHLDLDKREAVYARTEAAGTAISKSIIETQLEAIRTTGYAFTSEEAAASVAGLAVPIWAKDQKVVVGSLAIAGLTTRINQSSAPELLGCLRTAQSAIEGVMGLLR
jgi:IclR family acetate operon transcriptional repressor